MMSTQYFEFLAPFPQMETVQMYGAFYDYPGKVFPEPETISLSGGYTAMRLDFPDTASNDNKFNVIEGFELFRHTKRYIQTKHDAWLGDAIPGPTREQRLEALFRHAGLQHATSPENTIGQWKNLRGMIHKAYFEAIGIEPAVLCLVLEADAAAYMTILNSDIVISCFVVRYMSAVYEGKLIPKMRESQAIDYIRAFQQKMPLRCCINIRDIKSIFVELDDTVTYRYCYPEFRIEGDCYRFSGDNRDNAVVRVEEVFIGTQTGHDLS